MRHTSGWREALLEGSTLSLLRACSEVSTKLLLQIFVMMGSLTQEPEVGAPLPCVGDVSHTYSSLLVPQCLLRRELVKQLLIKIFCQNQNKHKVLYGTGQLPFPTLWALSLNKTILEYFAPSH